MSEEAMHGRVAGEGGDIPSSDADRQGMGGEGAHQFDARPLALPAIGSDDRNLGQVLLVGVTETPCDGDSHLLGLPFRNRGQAVGDVVDPVRGERAD